MNGGCFKSIHVSNKSNVIELNAKKYSAPCIVDGGAVFNKGLKLGFCDDEAPCDGSICSTNEKLLFFTNKNWNSVSVNGYNECSYLEMKYINRYTIDLSKSYMYHIILSSEQFKDYTIKLQPYLQQNSCQKGEILIHNKTGSEITFYLECDDVPIYNIDKSIRLIEDKNVEMITFSMYNTGVYIY